MLLLFCNASMHNIFSCESGLDCCNEHTRTVVENDDDDDDGNKATYTFDIVYYFLDPLYSIYGVCHQRF